jgi:plasmid segregation protein ParM
MLIAVDHGNKQIKLPEGRIFTSSLHESDTKPPFGDDILKYRGKYYSLSDKRIPVMPDKTDDDRFYILTLFAIAFDIMDKGRYETDIIPIQLAVGLPPAHYGAQYERFEKYFKRGDVEEFEFHGKKIRIYVNEVMSFPQAYSAVMPIYSQVSGFPKVTVVDIGGWTSDYLLIKKGQFNKGDCGSLEHGVIHLYNKVSERVNSDLSLLLDESDIDAILNGEYNDYGDDVQIIATEAAQEFISDLFGNLRERSYDLRTGKTVFVGGGSILLREQIEASGKVSAPIFIDKISANAKGYEILFKASKVRR